MENPTAGNPASTPVDIGTSAAPPVAVGTCAAPPVAGIPPVATEATDAATTTERKTATPMETLIGTLDGNIFTALKREKKPVSPKELKAMLKELGPGKYVVIKGRLTMSEYGQETVDKFYIGE